MKLTNEVIVKASSVIAQITPEQVSAKLYYRLCKISRKLQQVVDVYEETRKGLLSKYAKKDKDGQPMIDKDKYILNDKEQFDKEIKEIMAEENEVDIEPIPEEYLKEFKLPAGAMAWLLDLIDNEEK